MQKIEHTGRSRRVCLSHSMRQKQSNTELSVFACLNKERRYACVFAVVVDHELGVQKNVKLPKAMCSLGFYYSIAANSFHSFIFVDYRVTVPTAQASRSAQDVDDVVGQGDCLFSGQGSLVA